MVNQFFRQKLPPFSHISVTIFDKNAWKKCLPAVNHRKDIMMFSQFIIFDESELVRARNA